MKKTGNKGIGVLKRAAAVLAIAAVAVMMYPLGLPGETVMPATTR